MIQYVRARKLVDTLQAFKLLDGMDDHLSKPYTRLQMRAMLDKWLPVQDAQTAKAA